MQLFLRLCALLAATFAPLVMASGHAAVPAAATAAHCADMGSDHEPDRPATGAIECAIACTMLAVQPTALDAPPPAIAAILTSARLMIRGGISPGFDPPPPRG